MAADNRGTPQSASNPHGAVPEFAGTDARARQSQDADDPTREDRSDGGEDRDARLRAEARRQNDAGEGEVTE